MTNDVTNKNYPHDLLMNMYRTVRTIRRFEETGMDMYREGNIRGYFHTCVGQEGVAAGACLALRRNDYIVSTHRGHGHCIAKGADLRHMMAELFGKETGYSHGRGGSMHIADRATGNIGANGIVGGGIPLAVGVGMGIRLEKSDRIVVCFFGDGASNNGVFAESVNLAAVHSLPVVFVLENNCYAATTHIGETSRCEELSPRAAAYGVATEVVHGNDPMDIYNAVVSAGKKCRSGNGPVLIEAMTHRFLGHHVRDSGSYVPEDIRTSWKNRDPQDILRRYLNEAGIDERDIETADSDIEKALKEAVSFAMESREPDVEAFLKSIEQYDV